MTDADVQNLSTSNPIPPCYPQSMAMNYIDTIECLVEDYGWNAVIEELFHVAATAPVEELDDVAEIIKAAITVSEGRGKLYVLH